MSTNACRCALGDEIWANNMGMSHKMHTSPNNHLHISSAAPMPASPRREPRSIVKRKQNGRLKKSTSTIFWHGSAKAACAELERRSITIAGVTSTVTATATSSSQFWQGPPKGHGCAQHRCHSIRR